MIVLLALAGGLVVAFRATADATVPARGVPPIVVPDEPEAPGELTIPADPVPARTSAQVPTSSPTVTATRLSGRANPTLANLTLIGTVSASSVEGRPWAALNAGDGDVTTRWSSGFAEPQWLKVDLGERRQLTSVTLVWEHAYAIAYRIDTSLDGKTWKTIWATRTGEGGTVRVDATGAVARFVRMVGTKRSNQYGFSLFEMEVR